jgi:hypothetical protein
MMLVGAMNVGDLVVVATDAVARGRDSGRLSLVSDRIGGLRRHAALSGVLWACAGGRVVGSNFNAWFEARTFDDWSDLLVAAGHIVASLNSAARRIGGRAGTTREVVEVLFAGHLGSDALVAAVEANGIVKRSRPGDAMFVGSGALYAMTAWEAIKVAQGEFFEPEQCIRDAVDATIAAVPLLSGPAQLVEIRP